MWWTLDAALALLRDEARRPDTRAQKFLHKVRVGTNFHSLSRLSTFAFGGSYILVVVVRVSEIDNCHHLYFRGQFVTDICDCIYYI